MTEEIDRKAKRHFFWRFFFSVITPHLISLIVFGCISIGAINYYLNRSITRTNSYINNQISQLNTVFFNSFDSVNVIIESNIYVLNAIMHLTEQEQTFTSYDLSTIKSLNTTISAISSTFPAIESVYVYVDGSSRYYSSNDFISDFADGDHISWLKHTPPIEPYRLGLHIEREANDIVGIYLWRSISNFTKGIVAVKINYPLLIQQIGKLDFYRGQQIYLSNHMQTISLSGDMKEESDIDMVFSAIGNQMDDSDFQLYGNNYHVTKIKQSDWYFIIKVPQSSLYGVRNIMVFLLVIILLLTIGLGLLTAYGTTNANFKSVMEIIEAFEKAEKGEFLEVVDAEKNLYTYILYRIMKNGILRKYMENQISEKKYQMKSLEMKALQYQINPHFLINTLRTIYWKEVGIQGIDSSTARMIDYLINLLDYSLNPTKKPVSMYDEIIHTKSYCEILKIRHAGELDIEWKYGPEILNLQCCRLMLQPYIENAFYHGIRNSEKGKGCIAITAYREGNLLKISIRDNGIGMKPDHLEEIENSLQGPDMPLEHLGINNPNRRIKLTFGDTFGVHFTSIYGKGTTVWLTLPAKETNDRETPRGNLLDT